LALVGVFTVGLADRAAAQVIVAPAPVVSYYVAPTPVVAAPVVVSPAPVVQYYYAPAPVVATPAVVAAPTTVVSYYPASTVVYPMTVSRGLFGKTIVRTPFGKYKY
jgi:hypothetical protein